MDVNGGEHVLEDGAHELHFVRVAKVVQDQERGDVEFETRRFGCLLHGGNVFGERVGLDLEGQGGPTRHTGDTHVGAVLSPGQDHKVCYAQGSCHSHEIAQSVVFAFLSNSYDEEGGGGVEGATLVLIVLIQI